MKKILIMIIAFNCAMTWANSCFPIYESLREEIFDKHAENDTRLVPASGHLGGKLVVTFVKVPRIQDNWVDDFISAIHDGPYRSGRKNDPRRSLLSSFARSVHKYCDLKDHEFSEVRHILRTLMEDGSFCPDGKILNSKGDLGPFIRIFKRAVKSGQFSECSK